MVLVYIFFAQSVVCLFCAIPIFEAVEKNVSERMLPFDLHLDLPLTQTPYYEMAFFVEAAGMMSVGLCTTGFAGFLCTTNLYTAGQFKILQRKLELACSNGEAVLSHAQTKTNLIEYPSKWWLREQIASNSITKDVSQTLRIDANFSIDDNRADTEGDVQYNMLKNCIKEHQLLLEYMEKVENLSSAVMLAQALGSILKICFSGFQILLVGGTSILRTILSIQFVVGTLFLFFMFSWSSHEIIIESQALAEAVYRTSWYSLPYTTGGKACRQSLLIIIARAHKPCILTVGKFAPMSLRTFVSVFNTSISYFTILRQMNARLNE
uniref:Olfactory receptor 31 n=1 Tax=Meteorus pulchricornis TaxID=51522 RepID=A0A1S5VFM1_9HYME|nr:olfactory receptor 31 [Meteorus pulchricornis]